MAYAADALARCSSATGHPSYAANLGTHLEAALEPAPPGEQPGALPAELLQDDARRPVQPTRRQDEARKIAEKGMILRVQVGSGVHGTSITGQDDRDEMGLCLEPPQFVTGLARVPNGTGSLVPSVRFEQYERHTAWDRPGGLATRSGAGDLDVIIYSARKWARLALAGNPHRAVRAVRPRPRGCLSRRGGR
jgi:hypothetical protein